MIENSITVLIPTKNRRALLERAIASVFNQSVLPEEVIVVNDGSTDGTKEFLDDLIQKHNNLNVIHRDKNGGVGVARNQGIRETKSEWMVFLDDDDEFVPDAIKIAKAKLGETTKDYSIIHFNTYIDRETESFTGGFQFDNLRGGIKDFYDPSYEDKMTKFNLRGDCTPLIRRSLFITDGYRFPESVNGFESHFFNLTARDGVKARHYSDVLVHIPLNKNIEHLSRTASKKNPWPLFVLHFKQLFQHYKFYIKHSVYLQQKIVTMIKLLLRVIFKFK